MSILEHRIMLSDNRTGIGFYFINTFNYSFGAKYYISFNADFSVQSN